MHLDIDEKYREYLPPTDKACFYNMDDDSTCSDVLTSYSRTAKIRHNGKYYILKHPVYQTEEHEFSNRLFTITQKKTKERVVCLLKTFTTQISMEEQRRAHQNEIDALNQLEHNNIISIISLYTSEHLGILLPFYPQGDMSQYLKYFADNTPLCYDFLLKMTDTLSFIHSKNIIHGNICPQSILISSIDKNNEYVQFKLSNFTFSEIGKPLNHSQKYLIKHPMGSYPYIAPEAHKQEKFHTNHSFDTYGLAVIVHKHFNFDFADKIKDNKYIIQLQNIIIRTNLQAKADDISLRLHAKKWHDTLLSCALKKEEHDKNEEDLYEGLPPPKKKKFHDTMNFI